MEHITSEVKIEFQSGIRHMYKVKNNKVIIDKSYEGSIRNKIDMIRIEFKPELI